MRLKRNIFRLPVSGLRVSLRQPTGSDDLLLLESQESNAELGLRLIERLAIVEDQQATEKGPSGGNSPWPDLTSSDLDALLLHLRQTVSGDLLRADVVCPAVGCGSQFEMSFSIEQYLSHHRPRPPRGVDATQTPGWHRLRGTDVLFRAPSAADISAIGHHEDPHGELIDRCLKLAPQEDGNPVVAAIGPRTQRRVEAAMEALAPNLFSYLQGRCPECLADVSVYFDPQEFCLTEMRQAVGYLYEDVALLAGRFHWSERDILALQRSRRMRYVEIARESVGP